MTYTQEEISAIVNETVEHTVKDMQEIGAIVRLVAGVTQELIGLLRQDNNVKLSESSRGGMTAEKSLAWKAAVNLRERAAVGR